MKRNVVFFIRSLHLGGAEKQSILLSEELSKHHNVFLVILYREGHLLKEVDTGNNHMFFLEGNIIQKTILFYQFLRKRKIYILFNFLPSNNIIGSIVGKFAGVNKIYNGIRGTKIKSNWLKMKTQCFLSNYVANGIISNSYKARDVYSEYGYKRKKIIVIHNIIKVDSPMVDRRGLMNPINILSVGRFVEEKDYFTAIRAIQLLIRERISLNVSWHYYILGFGDLKGAIVEYIHKLGLDGVISVLDGQEDLREHYQNANIYLSTSKHEGMSNTIMEAMSYSLPIIATNAGDTPYLVEDEFNGFLCDVEDSLMIVKKLSLLINSSELRIRMGENSYTKVEEGFTSKKIILDYNKLIYS